MIVADANLIAYLILTGERTADAEAVYRKDPDWVVPSLCFSEMRSIVIQYHRRGKLTIAEAARTVKRAERLVEGRQADVDSRAVLDLAARSNCSSYDCEYVALAEALGVRLVTSDTQVLRAFPGLTLSPEAFLAAPSR